MSRMTEIRDTNSDDLNREIAELERKIWELRFDRNSEKAGNPSRIRQMRRRVARMKTVLRERQIQEQAG